MAIESEIEVLKSVVTKLDSSLEKISEVSNNIGRLLAVHDERLDKLEKTSDRRTDDIKELHNKISTQTKEIVEKIDKLEQHMEMRIQIVSNRYDEVRKDIVEDVEKISVRVETLERWRWYVIGGAVTIGYLIGNLADIVKFLK